MVYRRRLPSSVTWRCRRQRLRWLECPKRRPCYDQIIARVMPKLSVAIERLAAKPEVEFIKTKEREFARSMASCSPSLSTAGRFTYEKRRGGNRTATGVGVISN